MRKPTGIIAFIFVLVTGWMLVGTIAFFGDGTYTGHTGYCSSAALPLYNYARVGPLIIAVLLVLYWVVVESFLGYSRQAAVVRVLLPLCLSILAYLLYNICRYPFVNRSFGFLGQSGRQEGLHNVLMFTGSVYAVFLLLFTLRFQRKLPALKKLPIVTYAGVGVFFVAIALVYLFAEYETCFG